MSVSELLQHSELFLGLAPEQVERVAALGREVTYNAGDVIISEGAPTYELYIIEGGMVEVEVAKGAVQDVPGAPQLSSLVRLGQGQVFGEMALVDRGARSATVRCARDGTVLFVIPHQDFWALCEGDHHIGFIVMRNLAADMSLKLRYSNIAGQMSAGDE